MLLQFSDLQTKHEQTMVRNAACSSNQPHATGLTKGISDSFLTTDFFSQSQLCLGTIHKLVISAAL